MGENHSTANLPYGPLPVRPDDPDRASPSPPDQDQVADSPRFDADATSAPDEGLQAQPSSQLDLTIARGESDDDVHFGVAAKALGVSRKTVERMVKRGQLERGPSGLPATVSKRALVTVLEQRRGGVARAPGAADLTRSEYANLDGPWSQDATAELTELLRPVLDPLLNDFVAAQTRAALLENRIETITARAAQQRARDELLLALATGGWRQRRKARRMALRHYVLGDDVEA